MANSLEIEFVNGVINILDDYNIINPKDSEFKNLVKRIEEYFVLDWYNKDSIKASIKSEIKRYLIEIGITQNTVNRILTKVSKLLKEANDENRQEIHIEKSIELSNNTKSPPTIFNKKKELELLPNYYTIILDSNYLYNSYKSGGDFSKFAFNKPFYNLIEKIEEFDIYDYVNIGIPEVVYNEIIIQRVEKLKTKLDETFNIIDNYIFPEGILKWRITDREFNFKKYENLIKRELDHYVENSNRGATAKITIIPYTGCSLESISKRAFSKKPPFEGKNKKSDKGFKDALIWESILEYKKIHLSREIVFISEDKGFNEDLKIEFKKKFTDEIHIVNKGEEFQILEQIAEKVSDIKGDKSIDLSGYKEDELSSDFYAWYDTKDFDDQLIRHIDEYIEKKERFIKFNNLINIYDVGLESLQENKISLTIDCQMELENKMIKGEKFYVIEKFELRIKKNKDSFVIENISSLDL